MKELNFTEEAFPLVLELEKWDTFEKSVTSDGWASYECVRCAPGEYCVGRGKIIFKPSSPTIRWLFVEIGLKVDCIVSKLCRALYLRLR